MSFSPLVDPARSADDSARQRDVARVLVALCLVLGTALVVLEALRSDDVAPASPSAAPASVEARMLEADAPDTRALVTFSLPHIALHDDGYVRGEVRHDEHVVIERSALGGDRLVDVADSPALRALGLHEGDVVQPGVLALFRAIDGAAAIDVTVGARRITAPYRADLTGLVATPRSEEH